MALVFAIIVGFPIAVFIHEMGHVVAARLVGMRIELMSFGGGKVLTRSLSVAGVPLIIRSPLMPGATFPLEPWRIGRSGLALFALGGVFATLCALVLGGWILVVWAKEVRWTEPVGLGLIVSNALLLPPALLGGRSYPLQTRTSELALAFRLLAGKVDSTDFSDAWAQTLPREYRRVGEMLLDFQIAHRSGDTKLLAEARERLECRAFDELLPSSARIWHLDALATAGLIKGDQKALDKMDEWTSALIEMEPDSPTTIGSRGAGLVAIGRSKEGVALLERISFDEKKQIFESLLTAAFLARGLADLGDHAGAAAGIASARRLIGDVPDAQRTSGSRAGLEGMLDRLEAEISTLAPR